MITKQNKLLCLGNLHGFPRFASPSKPTALHCNLLISCLIPLLTIPFGTDQQHLFELFFYSLQKKGKRLKDAVHLSN